MQRLSLAIGRAAIVLVTAALVVLLPDSRPVAQTNAQTGGQGGGQTGPSGLPLPRYVSLKSDRVNLRAGPAQDHRVTWIFTKAGLPVEITAEFENWRRIRDSEGTEGWVYHSLLSGRRTAVVAPWSKDQTLEMRADGSSGSRVVALVEPGVLVDLSECDGTACLVSVGDVRGWLPQESLWGAYPGEVFK